MIEATPSDVTAPARASSSERRLRLVSKKSVESARGSLPWTFHKVALVTHRYVGLVLAVFLLVAGVTGSCLAFYEELDRFFGGGVRVVEPPQVGAPLLDPFELAARVKQALPAAAPAAYFDTKPGVAASIWIEAADDQWREAFVDPYTGRVLGSRLWGDLSEGTVNLMPFLYRLHYSLWLGEVGTLLFGIVALLWTFDCFVGAYLTLPKAEHRAGARRASFFRRWLPAWLLKVTRLFSLVFTWHRASGLWLWGLLLVFAWSAVGLNLGPVYEPVMKTVFGMHEHVHDRLPELPKPHPQAKLDLREAYVVGQRLMASEAQERGFRIERPLYLYHAAEHDAYVYGALTSLDVSEKYPGTDVYFDAQDGHFLGFDAASGISVGGTLTSWLYALHFAAIGGLWYRGFVVVLGLAVGALAITGVWIWWVKRQRRARRVASRDSSESLPVAGA